MKKNLHRLFDALLICLLLTGLVYRFMWTNWSGGADLHPDEYGLTGTITRLSLPKSLADYFNTRLSPISPYQKYDRSGNVSGPGADNRMRWGQWPIILIRAAAEASGNTGYSELRLMGRSLSALADALSIGVLFLIGKRLYGYRAGLLAAALSSLAVMQIQQSHFMTSDNFVVLFTVLSMYAAIRVAERPLAGEARLAEISLTLPSPGGRGFLKNEELAGPEAPVKNPRFPWEWYALFGVFFGMAVASKVNLAVLAGMIVLAGAASLWGAHSFKDLPRFSIDKVVFGLALAGLLSLVTFRLTQPMTFRAATGDTTLFTLAPNPDWWESMKVAQMESSGVNSGPPGEQWTDRLPLVFPWVNMVVWGMGPLLGLTAWAGLLWAAWRALGAQPGWRAHLMPAAWAGGYFLFMGTRHVMSMRYFLPVYPFFCLLAAWALLEWFRRARSKTLPALVTGLVLLGSLAWATAFVNAVYLQPNTRVEASRWIFANVPAPFNLTLSSEGGQTSLPLAANDGQTIGANVPYVVSFTPEVDGVLQSILIAHVRPSFANQNPVSLRIQIAGDPSAADLIAEAIVPVPAVITEVRGGPVSAEFTPAPLQKGKVYFLLAQLVETANPAERVEIYRTAVSNENWDESLPVRMDGYDPFGMFYSGPTMNTRWPEMENKRQMFEQVLAQTDYIILPSQRGIWSVPRLPESYPMTMEYYRALFDGRLGFELVAQFQHPFQFGPLAISDVGGTAAWGAEPELPLFNNNLLAAEEAFSVYDHAPVWVFKKRADFDMASVTEILRAFPMKQ